MVKETIAPLDAARDALADNGAGATEGSNGGLAPRRVICGRFRTVSRATHRITGIMYSASAHPCAPACPVLDGIGDHTIATLIRMYAITRCDLACPDIRCNREIKHIEVRNPK